MQVSTGINNNRKVADDKEPPATLIPIGKAFSVGFDSQSAKNPVFPKVSPNLETGPYIRAGPIPCKKLELNYLITSIESSYASLRIKCL